ncbi:LysE family transporter [Flavobacterium sp.]|uniref:LysE family transporter n=1 Tax=Flavobacterium sp. TaxID=239 RepID=UPI002632F14B|nr:LysE family transporter [Flavobacterium sp.]
MTLIVPFFAGLVAALVGVLPPGLINMTVAKVRLTDGLKRAMVFTLGALMVIAVQTYVSLLFARYISLHNEVVTTLRAIGFIVFVLLTFYFFFFAKKPDLNNRRIELKSKRSRFFLGMLISGLNVLPIPYYVFVSVNLASSGYFDFQLAQEISLVLGVITGSFLVFNGYMIFIHHLQSKTDFFIKNMNRMIGSITALVALLTFWNILKQDG